MKVVHISTSDTGGAGIAALRLHKGMLSTGFDSNMLILDGFNNPNQKIFTYFDYNNKNYFRKSIYLIQRHLLPILYHKKINKFCLSESFSFPHSFFKVHSHPLIKEADILNLHYISDFIDYPSFFNNIKKPIVWTLHDSNPFSGGFHSPYNKEEIPENLEKEIIELDKKISNKKLKYLSKIEKLIAVCPSKCLCEKSQKSRAFGSRDHYIIPHTVDLNTFQKRDKPLSREILGLDKDKKIILFIADRFSRDVKGFYLFIELCKSCQSDTNLLFCSIGIDDRKEIFVNPNYFNFGYINSERFLSIIYSAADILVQPSFYESFSLTTLEALACGLPIIAFETSGLKELVINKFNGLLCPVANIDCLKNGIYSILNDENVYKYYSKNAVSRTKEYYTPQMQIESYKKIYELTIR